MRTIADHVLDIGQNSVNAGAKNVKIEFVEDDEKILFKIQDDGCGMSDGTAARVFDPFFTTHEKIRRVGLGLPFLKQNTELTGGYVSLESKVGKGTSVEAKFIKNVDCQPMGNIAETFATLVTSSPTMNWKIERRNEEEDYDFSTEELEGVDLTSPQVIRALFEYFRKMEEAVKGEKG